MPVVPSFGSYAPKPDLAGAYLGARRADIAAFQAAAEYQLGQQRIAQAAAESQARIALGQQTLEARRVENEMELAARKEVQERENLRKQQEAQILNSYRQTQIGLAERRLAIAEAQEQQRIAEAAAAFEQNQEYNRLSALGLPADEIVRRMGPSTPAFATAIGEMNAREPVERKYNVVAGEDIRGTPLRLQMTAPEFQAWLPTAPPELRTNTINAALQGMLQPATGTNAPANEVIRRTKDGRRAVFNAQTKQFIRFAD